MNKVYQKINNIIQLLLIKVYFKKYLKLLSPGKVAIDCGANLGNVTIRLAKTGAEVHAFEPNPYAFEVLTEKLKPYKNVTCYPQGVWDKDATTDLYFHNSATNDQAFWSFGSSIIEQKHNVGKSKSVAVKIIDLTKFIEELDKPVELLKIDIEGAECELLEKFIEKELYRKVRMTLVETHDGKIKGQKVKTDKIRSLIKEKQIKNINLNWL